MAIAEQPLTPELASGEVRGALAGQWRHLTRAATAVAVLTSPAVFIWFHEQVGLSTVKSLIVTFRLVISFRGVVDLAFRRAIPWPSLFGSDSRRLRERTSSVGGARGSGASG